MPRLAMSGAASAGAFGFNKLAQAVNDAYFSRNVLLLPGNGTNGAQNNTFLDSSTNNFTITRNGNTTQGTFSPFSQTGWSNFFNGSSDYLNYATGQNIANFGTGDFTIEAWINPSAVPIGATSGFQIITSPQNGTNVTFYLQFYNSQLQFGVQGSAALIAQSWVPTVGQWVHVAVCRSGTNLRAFINGTQLGTTVTNSSNFVDGVVQIAYGGAGYLNGYVSNVRINKSALYTANFTPSTSPLAADANTVLLTCQSNRFVDNASKTVTTSGTPSVQAFSPFAPTAAYSAATNGGSGYFDGSGDYLVMATASAAINPSTSTTPFTIECWVYNTGTSSTVLFSALGSENYGFVLGFGSGVGTYDSTQTPWFGFYNGAWNGIRSTTAIPRNAWTHLACVFTGSTSYIYQDGVMRASGGPTTWGVTGSSKVRIGCRVDATTDTFTGYISGARVVIGSNLYPSGTTFTTPTAPPTAITNTSLLLNFTNAGITDATAKNVLETVGNAQISTTQSKFGGSSLYFDGTGDRLYIPDGKGYVNGTEPFTLECWVYLGGTPNYWTIFGSSSGSGLLFTVQNLTTVIVNPSNAGNTLSGTTSLTAGTWFHLALTRNSSNRFDIWVNGVSVGNATSSQSFGTPTHFVIGAADNSGGQQFNGYLDDVRISKFCRYTTTFTPPTAAFPLS